MRVEMGADPSPMRVDNDGKLKPVLSVSDVNGRGRFNSVMGTPIV